MLPVVWFTGLSGSGKSTLSRAVQTELQARCIPVAVVDGDVVRQSLSKDLGFTPEDRNENIRRISYLAQKLSQRGKVVLVAAISPYRALREEIRASHKSFLEVFVSAPLHICESRDPKGLYRRARAGKIQEFTGISAPYEEPTNPDLICETDRESIDVSCSKVVAGILAADAARTDSGPRIVNILDRPTDVRVPASKSA